MCTPGVCRSVYPCSAALEKYGKEGLSSEAFCFLIGSAEGMVDVEVSHYQGREGSSWEG